MPPLLLLPPPPVPFESSTPSSSAVSSVRLERHSREMPELRFFLRSGELETVSIDDEGIPPVEAESEADEADEVDELDDDDDDGVELRLPRRMLMPCVSVLARLRLGPSLAGRRSM